MLKIETTQPTTIIKNFTGRYLHKRAANGAAKRPPMTKPAIVEKGAVVINIEKKPAVARVKKNSAKLTEPIVNLGSCPAPTSVEVTIGPHPPPPAESMKPPVNASFEILESFILILLFLKIDFFMINIPMINRYIEIIGFIKSASSLVTKRTPQNAPIIPGSNNRMKSDLLTLPNLTCAIPDNPVVNTAAIWTLALATAGLLPVLNKKVVAEIPYAIPSAPSIICAKKPIITPVQKVSVERMIYKASTDSLPFSPMNLPTK